MEMKMRFIVKCETLEYEVTSSYIPRIGEHIYFDGRQFKIVSMSWRGSSVHNTLESIIYIIE